MTPPARGDLGRSPLTAVLARESRRGSNLPNTRKTAEARQRDAENKRRRVALARCPVSEKQCEVPGCGGLTLINEDDDITDCCYGHSLQGSDTDNALPNDGIIDWTAIDVAVQGARPVGLTWVEKDIVMATVLADGGNITQALERAG